MEDMTTTNAMQFMLMVYLDGRRWTKMPEESEGRSRPRVCPPQRLELGLGVDAPNAALFERL